MKILNKTQKTVIAEQVDVADTTVSRLVGLLNRKILPPNEALIITRCRSIHMFFMRFPIDAIFVDRHDRIVGLVRHIKPFRMSPCFFRASDVIELPVGTIDRTKSQEGDLILYFD